MVHQQPRRELSVVNYSDTTPDVTYTHDRRGRQTAITQTGGTTLNRLFNDAGQLLRESYTGGPLDGLSVTNTYDYALRRTNVSLLDPQSSVLAATAYAYTDVWGYPAGRLRTVSAGPHSATYEYLENSHSWPKLPSQRAGRP